MNRIRVALRSPDRLVRESVAASLAVREDVVVSGVTGGFADLLWLCRLRRADVALVDVGTEFAQPEIEGLSALRAADEELAIVLTFARLPAASVTAAFDAGATRMVPHSRGIQALIEAVVEGPRAPDRHPVSPAVLTDADLEILALMSAGYSVNEMARMFGVSPATAENRKRRLFAKLSAHSQTHAVARAARAGLLWAPPRRAPLASLVRVVLIVGTPGVLRDTVVRTLLRQAIPVLTLGPGVPATEDEVLRFRHPVTVVLIDGPESDWRTTRILGARIVVVVTEREQPANAQTLMRAANAVIPARSITDQLPHVVALVAQGRTTTKAEPTMAARSFAVRSDLSPRELDILRSIAQGHSVRQTARALGISSKTVENTQARLFRKLSVHNRAEALTVAYSLGLLEEAVSSRTYSRGFIQRRNCSTAE